MNEMFKIGDKVRLVRINWLISCSSFSLNDEFEIIEQKFGTTTLKYCGEDYSSSCTISDDILMECFEKILESCDNETDYEITEETINDLIDNAEFSYMKTFGRCTIASCKLPNGFIITESSACVSEDDYDEKIGKEICKRKIKDRLWEMEAYFKMNLNYLAEDACVAECEACSNCNKCAE